MNRKKITIKDIAKECNVSKTSVSFAFNNPSRLGKATRDKILSTAEKMGYFPDPLARNLILRKHNSIGFLLPQNVEVTLSNPYITLMIKGIAMYCQEKGYTLTIIPPLHSNALDAVKIASVDGLIVLGMDVDPEVITFLNMRRIPFVTIDGKDAPLLPSVSIDDTKASYQIMKEVLTQGHRRIAIVSLSADIISAKDKTENLTSSHRRQLGYDQALKEFGLHLHSKEISVLTCECTFEHGKQLVAQILSLPQSVTAIVSMSDITALGIIRGLQERKIEIPSDISVVGFDDIEESGHSFPSLTTVSQPGLEKGRTAAAMLFDYLENDSNEIKQVRLPFSIVNRETLGPARK
jgi:DNA-binding LacI/PurR family transcriptional regulator